MRFRIAGLALSVAVSVFRFLFDPSPAMAVDGVIEINQAKALAGGVTPGDTPGFPVLLTVPGSYRLTGKLDLRPLGLPTSANTDALWVVSSAGGVTIDLNGFSILGPTLCDPAVPSCADTGTGIGVRSNTQNYLDISNGTVFGMGSHGISILAGRLVNVVAESNGGQGMSLDYGRIERCTARRNGLNGFWANLSVEIVGSVAFENLGAGVAGSLAQVDSSHLVSNLGSEISLAQGLITSNFVSAAGITPPLSCVSVCAIAGNLFVGCGGASCFSGPGTIVEIPAGSNRCGNAACP